VLFTIGGGGYRADLELSDRRTANGARTAPAATRAGQQTNLHTVAEGGGSGAVSRFAPGQRIGQIPLAYFVQAGYLLGREFAEIVAMKITDILRAEHTVFHHLFDHIETTVPRLKTLAEVKSLAVLAAKVMAPHSKAEDDLFIEPLEHCFEQIGQRETFHHEHEIIEDTFAKIHKARELPTAKKLLIGAITASRKHFDKEERIVFPMAERILKAKTLTDLGSEWMKRRDAALK
jgi:hemerythrin-like domain-containing protein